MHVYILILIVLGSKLYFISVIWGVLYSITVYLIFNQSKILNWKLGCFELIRVFCGNS